MLIFFLTVQICAVLINLLKISHFYGEKLSAHKICARKFGRAKGAISDVKKALLFVVLFIIMKIKMNPVFYIGDVGSKIDVKSSSIYFCNPEYIDASLITNILN